MKRYVEYIKSKEPHHRRQHAMQLAGLTVTLLFVVWITTLGLRLGNGQVAQNSGDTGNQTSLSAAAAANSSGQNQLIVASTTQY